MYTLLCGFPPTRGQETSFDVVVPSKDAQDLVKGLLRDDPEERLSIREVLEHDWMNEYDDTLQAHDISIALSILMDW